MSSRGGTSKRAIAAAASHRLATNNKTKSVNAATLKGLSTRKMKQKALAGANADVAKELERKKSHSSSDESTKEVLKYEDESTKVAHNAFDKADTKAPAPSVSASRNVEENITSVPKSVEVIAPPVEKEEMNRSAVAKISTILKSYVSDVDISNEYGDSFVESGSKTDDESSAANSYNSKKLAKAPQQLASLLDAAKVRGAQGVNACGAIKVLTDKQASVVSLAHTYGVVSTLIEVISQESETQDTVVEFDDGDGQELEGEMEMEITVRLYGEASERAMLGLRNLANHEENLGLICHSRGVLSCLVFVIENDRSKLRMLACEIMSRLASSKENGDMVKKDGVLNLVSDTIASDEEYTVKEKRHQFIESQRFLTEFLLHLAKNPTSSVYLANSDRLMTTLIHLAKLSKSPQRATSFLSIVAHLSRLKENSIALLEVHNLIVSLTKFVRSNDINCKTHSVHCLLNISSELACREPLARSSDLLLTLCLCCSNLNEETRIRLAAMQTLKNLSMEPSNLVHFADGGNCIQTITLVANSGATGNKDKDMIQYIACDILANLSQWTRLLSIIGSKHAERCNETRASIDEIFSSETRHPTHRVRGYERWGAEAS